jgi:hypothetical protein
MEMFEMLGLTPQNHLQKFLSLLQLKLRALNLPLLRKTKMVKTGHTLTGILKPQLKESKFHTYKKTHSAYIRLNGFFYDIISLINHLFVIDSILQTTLTNNTCWLETKSTTFNSWLSTFVLGKPCCLLHHKS